MGRIGRAALRIFLDQPKLEVVAVNDLGSPKALAHLLQYDSVHGKYGYRVEAGAESIIVHLHHEVKEIPVFCTPEPQDLPWGKLGVQTVLESTGKWSTAKGCQRHLKAGATRVVLASPPKDESGQDEIKLVCMGVNHEQIRRQDKIISNASCTTNNLAPLIAVLDGQWGIKEGFITTVHSYTMDQNLQDGMHKDLRRARAAAENIIPTTTGAAKAITAIFPHLEGKLGGAGIRVPVPNGSLTDFTCKLKKEAQVQDINRAFEQAAQGRFKNILEYSQLPLVSRDIIGSPYSCVFDSQLTTRVGDLIKVVGWYDNEMGYSHRLADLLVWLGQELN